MTFPFLQYFITSQLWVLSSNAYKYYLHLSVLVVKTNEVNIRGVLCDVVVDVTNYRYNDYLYKSHRKAYGNPVDKENYQLKIDINNWIEAQKEMKPLKSRVCNEDDLPF
jgi:hypothetical protein